MKKLFILVLFFMNFPLFSIGFNANFELGAGIAENIGSNQIEKNINIWENFNEFGKYLNLSCSASADVVFTQNMVVEAGVKYKNINLNYITEKKYANDNVNINFSVIQMPILFKYSIPIIKTVDIISSINIAGGINLSVIAGKQTYTDSLTKDIGNFVSPIFDFGAIVKVTYSHKIGPGKFFCGISADINFIQQKYKISSYDVNIGNVLTVAPVIGYTFILKEDKGVAKITEKNKRIKDIDVE